MTTVADPIKLFFSSLTKLFSVKLGHFTINFFTCNKHARLTVKVGKQRNKNFIGSAHVLFVEFCQ